ncbi:MAG: TonB-dependent receptor plug domain-containing protein, partial [Methylotenera sp.]|uniref:TonB-dependent receptor plug domain-containing protein n=1 Tax=Methylotenera sp. TaxID=2051956 RepID=UPI00271F5487
MKRKQLFILVTAIVSPQAYAEDPISLAPVVVTATRTEQNSFDLPVSIDVVNDETIRDGRQQVNLSESAARIPGVVVANKFNLAQDLAVSTRGFGARSAFGVRGVRLYADGIPLSMPDG